MQFPTRVHSERSRYQRQATRTNSHEKMRSSLPERTNTASYRRSVSAQPAGRESFGVALLRIGKLRCRIGKQLRKNAQHFRGYHESRNRSNRDLGDLPFDDWHVHLSKREVAAIRNRPPVQLVGDSDWEFLTGIPFDGDCRRRLWICHADKMTRVSSGRHYYYSQGRLCCR